MWQRVLRKAKQQGAEEFIKKYRARESHHGALLFNDFPGGRGEARRFSFRVWAKKRLLLSDRQIQTLMPPQSPAAEPIADASEVDEAAVEEPSAEASDVNEAADVERIADAADVDDEDPDTEGPPGTGDRAPGSPHGPAGRRANIHVIVECDRDAQVMVTVRRVRPRGA
jgi:hypothetical protein